MSIYQLTPWPPPDATVLVERWTRLKKPPIPLNEGIVIHDLIRWLAPAYVFNYWRKEELAQVRAFLGV